MIVNRIAFFLGGALSWVTFPIGLITNLGGGCLVSITFGLILLPLSLIWMLIMGLLLAISWLWERVPWPLQVPLAIGGAPLAAIGYAYVLMIPEPGEEESRRSKILLCQTFPFEMDLIRYRRAQASEREDRTCGRTSPVEAAFQQLPSYNDPTYEEAYRNVEKLWEVSLVVFGLDRARYARMSELLYRLGERDG